MGMPLFMQNCQNYVIFHLFYAKVWVNSAKTMVFSGSQLAESTTSYAAGAF